MKIRTTLLIWVWACTSLFAQKDDFYEVVAEQGDGIFSILRKQGLDPVKHYEEFVKLNSETIKNGSFLQVGVAYKIPKAADSFKKTGILVKTEFDGEEPIFDKELAKMSLKSERLKDAVYYLIVENMDDGDADFINGVSERLAAELMVHGAKVYVMGNETSMDTIALSEVQKMGRYTEIINKRYLQNKGKYQRVLYIQANGITGKENLDVAVYHYNNSDQGQRFAESIQNIFKKNSVVQRTSQKSAMVFEDKNSLYLAKNILPAISVLTLEKASKESKEKIPVRPDKSRFAAWISDGIMNDYVDLEIEN